MSEGHLRNLDGWDPAPLRLALRRNGYHKDGLESLGLPERWMRSAVRRASLLGHVSEGSPLEALIRLFTLGDPVDGNRALKVLGASIHGLLEIGFLVAGQGQVHSTYQIFPTADGWMACDFHARQGEGTDDYTMGIGPSSILLASLTPAVKGRALELASGIGWLAASLEKLGMPVVASDLNRRAIELGRFSARLNGIAGTDYRLGDGFSSVKGEMFDLIDSNPPYVQSPGGSMTYKEAPQGDPICARLLGEIPDHLAPDGIAVVLINWTHASDDDWQDAPLSWVSGSGAQRWLFQSDCSSPADYAWTWISGDLRFTSEDSALAEMRRWMAHYETNAMKRISAGFMVIRKCMPGYEWPRTEQRSAENFTTRSGEDVLRVLESETWLAGNSELLEFRFKVPDGVRSEVRMNLGHTGWERESIRLTSPQRLAYDGQIDENLLRLLSIVREGGTAAEMVREIREKPEFAAITDLPERVCGLVRERVSYGLLIPV